MKNVSAFTTLSFSESLAINGGADGPTTSTSFWHDAAYVIGATCKSIYYFCTKASEYQASLPANLKK